LFNKHRTLTGPDGTANLRRDRRGVAAAEFAIIGSAILFVVAGLFDIGTSVQERLVLQQALRAGGQYAQSFPNQTSGIIAAVQEALPWTDVTPPTVTQCFCSQGSQPSNCASLCTGSTGSYVLLGATHAFSPLMFPSTNCTDSSGNTAICVSYAIQFQ
jgi:Flp pilus assembly pilin Flp